MGFGHLPTFQPRASGRLMVDLGSRNSETFGLATDVKNFPKNATLLFIAPPQSPRISVTSITLAPKCPIRATLVPHLCPWCWNLANVCRVHQPAASICTGCGACREGWAGGKFGATYRELCQWTTGIRCGLTRGCLFFGGSWWPCRCLAFHGRPCTCGSIYWSQWWGL